MLTLVLFNLTTASVVLWLSIGFASVSVASLVGTLIMLFKFVFPLSCFIDPKLIYNEIVSYSQVCWSIAILWFPLSDGYILFHSFTLRLKHSLWMSYDICNWRRLKWVLISRGWTIGFAVAYIFLFFFCYIKYGVELDVPAATILSTFGFRAQVYTLFVLFLIYDSHQIILSKSFWWPNISLLVIFFVLFTSGSFITLHYFVKEKR